MLFHLREREREGGLLGSKTPFEERQEERGESRLTCHPVQRNEIMRLVKRRPISNFLS